MTLAISPQNIELSLVQSVRGKASRRIGDDMGSSSQPRLGNYVAHIDYLHANCPPTLIDDVVQWCVSIEGVGCEGNCDPKRFAYHTEFLALSK